MALTEVYEGIRLQFEYGIGRVTRRFVSQGLTASTNPSDLFAQAAAEPNLPKYTNAHPTIPNLYVATYNMAPFIEQDGSTSKTAVWVEVGYSSPTYVPLGGQRVQIGGSNGQYVLNKWPSGSLKGQPILIGYSPSGASFPNQIPPASVPSSGTGSTQYDTAQIPVESPNLIIKVTRTELTPPNNNFSYRRKLNSVPWMGFDAYTVLCRDIQSVNMVSLGTIAPNYWTSDYIFEVVTDPKEWVRVEFFRDIHTGKPIPGTNLLDGTNNGYTLVTPYDTIDFNGLKFTPLFV